MIKLKVLNVPSGITFIWPGQDHEDAEDPPVVMKDLRETATLSTEDDTDSSRHLNSCRLVCRPTPPRRSMSSWRWIYAG